MWKRPERLNMLVISSAGQLLLLLLLLRRFTGTTTEGTVSGLPAMLTAMITGSGERTITGKPAEHVTGTCGSCPGFNPGLHPQSRFCPRQVSGGNQSVSDRMQALGPFLRSSVATACPSRENKQSEDDRRQQTWQEKKRCFVFLMTRRHGAEVQNEPRSREPPPPPTMTSQAPRTRKACPEGICKPEGPAGN